MSLRGVRDELLIVWGPAPLPARRCELWEAEGLHLPALVLAETWAQHSPPGMRVNILSVLCPFPPPPPRPPPLLRLSCTCGIQSGRPPTALETGPSHSVTLSSASPKPSVIPRGPTGRPWGFPRALAFLRETPSRPSDHPSVSH